MPETVTGEGRALADLLERQVAVAREGRTGGKLSTRAAAHVGWTVATNLPLVLAALRERGSVSLDRERCGAEAMREACARWHEGEARRYDGMALNAQDRILGASGFRHRATDHREHAAAIRALPIPGGEHA